MNKKDMNNLRQRLLQELGELSSGNDCNLTGLDDSEENFPDLVDRASSFIDRRLNQNFCDRTNLKIRKIESALRDMKSGDYGICQQCGEDIALKRLKANPVARHCIHCKADLEIRERLTGD